MVTLAYFRLSTTPNGGSPRLRDVRGERQVTTQSGRSGNVWGWLPWPQSHHIEAALPCSRLRGNVGGGRTAAMSETGKLAAVLCSDVIGYCRLGADGD